MTLKPSKVLMAAADLLERGWCQKHLGIRDRATHWIAARVYGLPILYRDARAFQPGVEIDRVCLQGAILKAAVDLAGVGWPMREGTATPEQEAMRASYRAAEQAVGEEIASRTGVPGTARWNDTKGRTQAEVVALVQDVAALMEAAGGG